MALAATPTKAAAEVKQPVPVTEKVKPDGESNIVPLCLPQEKDCIDGVWFELTEAKRMLRLDNKRQELVVRSDMLEKINAARGRQITRMERQMAAQVDVLGKLRVEVAREKRRADELTGRFSEMWRSPYLWFAVGLVAGGSSIAYMTTR